MQKILVLDFGGQYNQLIARRVREHHIYAEIKPYNKITVDEIKAAGYTGIIFTGGPNSVYDPASPHYDPAILDLGIPLLGICYGCQLIAYMAGGTVTSAENSSEYGKVELTVDDDVLFDDVPRKSVCWMSHRDYISVPPEGFTATARTAQCPTAAMCDESRRIYAVQFHPEVTHTEYGAQILHNFLYNVCGCTGDWQMDSFVENKIAEYREKLSGKKALQPRREFLGGQRVRAHGRRRQGDGGALLHPAEGPAPRLYRPGSGHHAPPGVFRERPGHRLERE